MTLPFEIMRAPRRRRLPSGGAGLRLRLTLLAAPGSSGPYSRTVPFGQSPRVAPEKRASADELPTASLLLVCLSLGLRPSLEHLEHPVGDEPAADHVRRGEHDRDEADHLRERVVRVAEDEDRAHDH